MTTLSYSQLRSILALVVTSQPIRVKLEDILSGKEVRISETSLLELILSSDIDSEIIRILTGQDPATMDAFQAIEVIADFFVYMKANSAKLLPWLSSIASPSPKNPSKHPSKNSK
jgi:hypothetical protein